MTAHFIFDLDGTLADTEYETSIITADLAQEMGWDISPQEVFVRHAGLGSKEKFQSIAAVFGANPSDEQLEYLSHEHERRKKEIYLREHVTLIPGALELLAALSQGDTRLSLASTNTSDRSKLVLDKTGMRPAFGDRIVGPDMTEGRKKPDPAVYLLAMAQSGIPASQTYIVEDTLPGIIAGHAAGGFVIALLDPRFGNGEDAEKKMEAFRVAGANAIIRSLDGVLQVVPVPQKQAAVATLSPQLATP